MLRAASLLAASSLLLLVFPATARAYCRTTTIEVTPGYDSTVRGCPAGSIFLAWPSMPVQYQVYRGASAQVSLHDATAIIDRSFAKWPAASCSGGHPALSVQNLGPTDAADPLCDDGGCPLQRDAVHAVYFRDDTWPYVDPSHTLALTTVSYGVETGHVFAAVMEINSHMNTLSTASHSPPGAYSLEAIVTHEAGHFVGLAHSVTPGAIMAASYQADDVTLTPDDEAGVCAIYPPSAPSSGGCAAAGGGPGAGGGPMTALIAALIAAGALKGRLFLARTRRAQHFGATSRGTRHAPPLRGQR